jgi:N-acyl-D-aspartate/D-glutamate deacylase
VWPQISPRPTDVHIALARTIAFSFIPAWHKLVLADPAEKRRMLADPWWRGKAREHWDRRSTLFFETEPSAYPRLRLRAATTGPEFVGFDALLAHHGGHPSDALADWIGENDFEVEILKLARESTEACAALLADPGVLVGSSDAGAHCQSFCGAGDTTWLLVRHVRERRDLSVERAVERLTAEPADHFGIRERGRLEPGAVADLAIFDLDRLEYLPDELVSDLPGGGARLRRAAAGYRATIVNGVPVQLDGKPTGALPGGML